MISLTAFRSVFVANVSKRREKKRVSPWLASTPKVFRSHRKRASEDQELADLTIPSATLTGLRTLIRGDQKKTSRSVDETLISDSWSLKDANQQSVFQYDHQSTPV
ncbi:MAG: hypothetical protein M1830_006728 [Pleopsidium flavum]|nr:MAG: hypothetical protein M1830_006728 [Pleopsidium flavum]